MARRQAFSLMETIVSLFLMSIVLVLLGDLAREYRRVSLAAETQQSSTRALECLRDLSGDLKQAYLVSRPLVNAQAYQLDYQKIRSDFAYLPLGSRAGWTPVPPAAGLISLAVKKEGEQLVRSAGTQRVVLLEPIESFQVGRDDRGQFTLSIRQSGQDSSCRLLVYRAANL